MRRKSPPGTADQFAGERTWRNISWAGRFAQRTIGGLVKIKKKKKNVEKNPTVGKIKPQCLGPLRHGAGSLAEWVQDWYDSKYYSKESDA